MPEGQVQLTRAGTRTGQVDGVHALDLDVLCLLDLLLATERRDSIEERLILLLARRRAARLDESVRRRLLKGALPTGRPAACLRRLRPRHVALHHCCTG